MINGENHPNDEENMFVTVYALPDLDEEEFLSESERLSARIRRLALTFPEFRPTRLFQVMALVNPSEVIRLISGTLAELEDSEVF